MQSLGGSILMLDANAFYEYLLTIEEDAEESLARFSNNANLRHRFGGRLSAIKEVRKTIEEARHVVRTQVLSDERLKAFEPHM